MTGVLKRWINNKMKKGHKDTEKRPPCEDEGRDWSDAGTSQRIPGPPEAGGSSGGTLPSGLQSTHGPADTLTLDL